MYSSDSRALLKLSISMMVLVQAGGTVEDDEGTPRVEGLLGVSRAIGDAYLKKYVICTPNVRRHVRSGKQAFLVLGSDGLWDDLTPEDVASILDIGGLCD